MKPIEERANQCADFVLQNVDHADALLFRKLIVESFITGAESEHQELLYWRCPKIELPETDVEVLVNIDAPKNKYDIMKHNEQGWWQKAPGGGWCAPKYAPIGWRPIIERL